MPAKPLSAPDLARIITDNYNGTTALHQAAAKGTLSNLSGVTAELLANVKDNDGWTPLHAAANHGHLDQIPSLTAEFLATVKDNDGWTPLDRAAKQNQLAQITDFTITLATTLNILSASLRPENIAAFTEDFRRHGAAYNKCPAIRRALLRASCFPILAVVVLPVVSEGGAKLGG